MTPAVPPDRGLLGDILGDPNEALKNFLVLLVGYAGYEWVKSKFRGK